MFIGRERELQTLRRYLKKKTASLLVIRGRRRIGKSRLIEEFAKPHRYYVFSGIPPAERTTAQTQRDVFMQQLASQTGLPEMQVDDWAKLFLLLADKVKTGRAIILLDEISWMGSKDATFLGKLKNAWDLSFKQNPELILILCGSASSWIEKNILGSTGFLGRISHTLTVEEMPLKDCVKFWRDAGNNLSAREKLSLLSVTGGIPRYLEEVEPGTSADDNIRNLCFTKGGMLVNEFENIFSDLFLRHSEFYKKIVNTLAKGDKEYKDICRELNVEQTGRMSEYLEELQQSGFITRDYTWNLNTGRDARISKYRLSDNYLRFYLKYVDKHRSKIERNNFAFRSISSLPEWDTVLALQFENLVLNNRQFLYHEMGIREENIVSENPFFQHRTSKQPGCQVDYMIQTTSKTLYIFEIKFSRNTIGPKVIDEVQQKIDRIRPRGFSYRPVLVHTGKVSEKILKSDFFAGIIDFSKALRG